MQKGENEREAENSVRSVWRVLNSEDHDYVPRCSFCGYFKKELRAHWFFTGLYCRSCIQEVLWNDVRTFKEMEQ